MEKYHKITKEDIDLPNYCYFFISEIIDSLKENDISNVGDEIEIVIESFGHPYCYDGINLVVKTFRRKGFELNFPHYMLSKEDGKKLFPYTWVLTLKKKSDYKDLPF